MRVTTDDGVGLAVEVLGDGPPFVMVHGFTGAKEDFADHAPAFAEHEQVILFDHRGHGDSDKPTSLDAYSLDRLADDVVEVAVATGHERFRLLGHSMGGMVARRVVLAHPERVDALLLMDTSPGKPESVDPDLAEVAAVLAIEEGMDVLRKVLDEANLLGSPADDRVRRERVGYEAFCAAKWAAMSPAGYAGLVRDIVHQPNQLDALRAVTCPTLVIVGDQDEVFLADASRMADAIEGAQLAVIPDAGHSPQFEAPDAWFATVDGFLRTL